MLEGTVKWFSLEKAEKMYLSISTKY